MKALNIIVLILVIIGAILLGIMGIVALGQPALMRFFPGDEILAIIIGLAGLYAISFFGKIAQ